MNGARSSAGRSGTVDPARRLAPLGARERHVRPERALLGLVQPRRRGGARDEAVLPARERAAAVRQRQREQARPPARHRLHVLGLQLDRLRAARRTSARRSARRRARTGSRGTRASRAATPGARGAGPDGRRTPSPRPAARAARRSLAAGRAPRTGARAGCPGRSFAMPYSGADSRRSSRRSRCRATAVERSRMSPREPGRSSERVTRSLSPSNTAVTQKRHAADRLVRRAAVRPRDAGQADRRVGAEALERAVGKRLGDLVRDRAVLLDQLAPARPAARSWPRSSRRPRRRRSTPTRRGGR